VVIGGGLVGLDAAYALLQRKEDITVVDIAPRVLAMNLDETAASAYQERFEEAGVKFHLGRKVMNTAEDAEGNVTQVGLDDGTVLSCDFLVVAAGVRPSSSFLDGSGITVERSVVVDQYLATNHPDVYAAGDVAGISGIWPNAKRQGEVAGKNMCGAAEEYVDRFSTKNTVNFFGLLTLSAGAMEPEEGDQVVYREDSSHYQKYIMRDGYVAGVVLQGDISRSGFWQYLIKNKIRVDRIQKPVWKLSYSDFVDFKDNGEYLWAVNSM
jgi:NAD(P)H-nitrite reductase large subunit